jgi:cobalt-zinc-cadmium efflux system protein
MTHEHNAHRLAERRGLTLAIIFTGTILLAEIVGGILTNSLALLADAGHMLVDVASLVMSFLALTFALRPPSKERTFGFHRLEILAALANGVTLILICFYIFYEAYQRILTPEPVQGPGMLAIALVGLVANVAAIMVLEKGESLNVRSAFLHVLGDTLSSMGIIVGGLVMFVTGWYIIDPIISVLIALLILISAYRVTMEAVNVLLEATPRGIDLREVVEAVQKVDGVRDIHDVHIWSITSGLHALSAHLLIDDQLTSCSVDIVERVQSLLKRDFGIAHTTLQCECEHCTNGEMVCVLDRSTVPQAGHGH